MTMRMNSMTIDRIERARQTLMERHCLTCPTTKDCSYKSCQIYREVETLTQMKQGR